MKAIVYEKYGPPEVLHLAEVEKPVPADDEVLIKIRAVSVNGSDREGLIGKPLYARMGGLRKPRERILGSDISGQVEAVGKQHTEFKPGDEVFGEIPGYGGGFAEYVCTRAHTMALKPAGSPSSKQPPSRRAESSRGRRFASRDASSPVKKS